MMNGSREPSASGKGNHYPILDALRFFLALWVTLDHSGPFPLFAGVDTSTALGRFLTHAWSSVFFGVPAVIGFFIISGFCIHLPFMNQKKLPVGRYYARRYTRILVPVFVAVWIWRVFGNKQPWWGEHSILWQSVLWSLVCEEIYYALYPLVRWIRVRYGWARVFGTSFALSVGFASTHLHAVDWTAYGPIGTAFLLYPVWLLGCTLAEKSAGIPALDSAWVIWKWRFFAWAGSWVCEMLHFKTRIHIPLTMFFFGVLAWLWMEKEIAYGKTHSPSRLLVFGGAWSYSLYLIHPSAPALFQQLRLPNLGYVVNWCAELALALAMSYVFYLLVERPSHRLARRIRVTDRRPEVPAPDPIPSPRISGVEPESSPVVRI